MATPKREGIQIVAVNRHARHDFFIVETFEAGMELKGSEVKSIRNGEINLKEGYAHIKRNQLYLEGVHVKPYKYSSVATQEPVRSRRLLMHRKEIDRLDLETHAKRLTLVPLRVYFKKGRAKIELGLAKGKKAQDKRQSIKKADAQRDIDRAQKARKR